MLEMVELPPEFASRYPMELSGGQKQRINMARSLAANPEVMLCDEVTSALDTIVGANVIDLLTRLQDETGVSFAFISHDLSTVASFSDEIVVLRPGTDPAFALGIAREIIEAGLYDEGFVKGHTDLPLLVRMDTQELLRASHVLPGYELAALAYQAVDCAACMLCVGRQTDTVKV